MSKPLALVVEDHEDHTIIFNNAFEMAGFEAEIITDGALYIEDDTIREIGKTEDLKNNKAELVIDAKNKIVMPGLIDTHIHLSQALIRGCADDVSLVDWLKKYVWVLQGNFTKDDGRVSTELCMAEMIRTGTTSFIDCMIHTRYGFDGIAKTVEQVYLRAGDFGSHR